MIKTTSVAILGILSFLLLACIQYSRAQQIVQVSPGIWKIVYGETEMIKPGDFKNAALMAGLNNMPASDKIPDILNSIKFSQSAGGTCAELVLDPAERIYGFGLQVNTFEQRGYRREIRTN